MLDLIKGTPVMGNPNPKSEEVLTRYEKVQIIYEEVLTRYEKVQILYEEMQTLHEEMH